MSWHVTAKSFSRQGDVLKMQMSDSEGSPLSPLLSNVMLDVLDKELEKRGHRFCRYADDGNVYVRSLKAGLRVMSSLRKFLQDKFKLKVNERKSQVDRVWNRKFLGFTFSISKRLNQVIAGLS
jgi:retron-type reverse transcriptase